MEQKQVRPVRHVRTNPQAQDEADELWPRSAREFLKPPSLTSRRKGFTYRSDRDGSTERPR